MSEKQRINIETLDESEPSRHEQTAEQAHHQKQEIAKAEAHQAEALKEARQEIAKESAAEKDKILEKLNVETSETTDHELDSRPVNSDLKKTTFNKEIKHIRRKLSNGDRLGSRIIHQPVIKSISEVSSKTITRPSGLLGGGIVAFLGTSTYLYLTKHIGLKYNYSMFLFLLVAGFILGLLIEALIRLTRSRRVV